MKMGLVSGALLSEVFMSGFAFEGGLCQGGFCRGGFVGHSATAGNDTRVVMVANRP